MRRSRNVVGGGSTGTALANRHPRQDDEVKRLREEIDDKIAMLRGWTSIVQGILDDCHAAAPGVS